MKFNTVKVIGFDADDTLWINESYFRETEQAFARLFSDVISEKECMDKLYNKEVENLGTFGYGIKNFIISMIETAISITNEQVDNQTIAHIIGLGRQMAQHPVVLLDKVADVLEHLFPKYRLILVTKGDLMEQERKLALSGLEPYFHHIEIMSEKHEENYRKLINHLDIKPNEFLMIGNSIKSDIIPPLNLGCYAIHVPYETTWLHEIVHDPDLDQNRFAEVKSLHEILKIIG